jgi:hypothetical protein
MLVPEAERGCTVIGCRCEHHALLDYAYTGHVRAVAALFVEAVATRSGHEIAGFVPLRERPAAIPHFRFDSSVSRKLASNLAGSCSSSARCETLASAVGMLVLMMKRVGSTTSRAPAAA